MAVKPVCCCVCVALTTATLLVQLNVQCNAAAAAAVIGREETSLTRKATAHRYDSDEEAFN